MIEKKNRETAFDEGLLARTHQKIREYEAGNLEAPELPPYQYKNVWKKWIAVAAVLTGISLFCYWFIQSKANTPASWVSIDVLPGQQQKIVLPDNSIVYVNAGSHIEYPLSFTDSIREIRLDGEAFFEVTPNANQPFVVHSGALLTRVLGTSFNIRAYKNEGTQSVLVAIGKVQVNTNEKSLDILFPNRLLTYNIRSKDHAVTDQLAETMDWKQNRMAFDDISFKDLAADLGRRYGKTFVFVNPSLGNCHYRAVFNNLPVEKILTQLSLTNSFTYTVHADTILLKGKGCN